MNWLKSSRQRLVGAVAILLLMPMLAACGTPANAANTGAAPNSGNTVQSRTQPARSNAAGAGIRSTDQQVQLLLRQLDGAQSDVNNADAGTSQDNAQP